MNDAVVAERRRRIGLDNAGDFEWEPLLLSDGADRVQRASRQKIGLVAIERVDPPLAHLERQRVLGKRTGQRLERLVAHCDRMLDLDDDRLIALAKRFKVSLMALQYRLQRI